MCPSGVSIGLHALPEGRHIGLATKGRVSVRNKRMPFLDNVSVMHKSSTLMHVDKIQEGADHLSNWDR